MVCEHYFAALSITDCTLSICASVCPMTAPNLRTNSSRKPEIGKTMSQVSDRSYLRSKVKFIKPHNAQIRNKGPCELKLVEVLSIYSIISDKYSKVIYFVVCLHCNSV